MIAPTLAPAALMAFMPTVKGVMVDTNLSFNPSFTSRALSFILSLLLKSSSQPFFDLFLGHLMIAPTLAPAALMAFMPTVKGVMVDTNLSFNPSFISRALSFILSLRGGLAQIPLAFFSAWSSALDSLWISRRVVGWSATDGWAGLTRANPCLTKDSFTISEDTKFYQV
eukprot:XP_011663973.1 PREDICTED: uncharacterized protein LOC105438172 [Strongylocentrotus purpuratus]